MNKKNKKRAGLIVIFIIINIILLIVLAVSTSLKKIPLDKRTNLPSGLVVVETLDDNNQPQFSTFRLSDGKEQKLEGNWKFSFIKENQIMIYGFAKNSTSSQAVYTINDKTAQQKNASGLPGTILNIVPSASGNYISITGIDQQKSTDKNTQFYTCAVKTDAGRLSWCKDVIEDILIKNNKYNSNLMYSINWHDNKDKLIIAENKQDGSAYVYDMATKKLEDYDKKQAKKQDNEQKIKITKIGWLTFLRNKKDKKSFAFIPFNGRLIALGPAHLLQVKGNKAYLIDMRARKKSELFTLASKKFRITSFFQTYHSP